MKPCWFIILGLYLLAAESRVSAQIFLRLDGVTGSSADTNHVGWMELNGIQCSVGRAVSLPSSSDSGGHSSPPFFSPLTINKISDAGTPALAFGALGDSVTSGTIDFVKFEAGQLRCLRMNLTNILISAYSLSGNSGSLNESIDLSPLAISWNYSLYNATNALSDAYQYSIWNVALNTGSFGTNSPTFVVTGIRKINSVQLSWNTVLGRRYRIFAATDLNRPFMPIAQIAASTTGLTNYSFNATEPAMFYTVEQIPDGY